MVVSAGQNYTGTDSRPGGVIVLTNAEARLNISGGIIRNTSTSALARVINNHDSNHADAVVITGGRIAAENITGTSATIGVAIRNGADGNISISGQNTVIRSGASNSTADINPGTIFMESGSGDLTVSGGATIENTRTDAPNYAIYQHDDYTGTFSNNGGIITGEIYP